MSDPKCAGRWRPSSPGSSRHPCTSAASEVLAGRGNREQGITAPSISSGTAQRVADIRREAELRGREAARRHGTDGGVNHT